MGDVCDADDDNDGVSDVEEDLDGTDPFDSDSDDDGVNDGMDQFPLDAGESVDTDLDGLGDNADQDDNNDGQVDVLQDAQSDISALLGVGDKKDDKELEKALKSIEDALDAGLWLDTSLLILDPKDGHKVFSELKKAAKDLQKLIKNGGPAAAGSQAALEALADLTEAIAMNALDSATLACTADKCLKELDKATVEMADAADERLAGDLDKAIDDYKKAWEYTTKMAGEGTINKGDTLVATLDVPATFELLGNYPNPFNPVTTIRFNLPESARVSLAVFDAAGREVARLVDGVVGAGVHEASLNAAHLPSGMYLSRFVTPAGTYSKSMILMK